MKYIVSGMMSVSCWTEVEADSKEEALEIAKQREASGMCYNPFTEEVDEEFHFSNDGVPIELTVYESQSGLK
jgi:hypothetical protein